MSINDYSVLVIISGVLNVLLAIYAYFKKSTFSGIKAFIWSSAFSAVYIFAYVFELSSDSLQEIRFWLNIEYLGMPFIAPCSLLLVLHYIGMERYAAFRKAWVFFVIPLITLALNTTNDLHHLFYKLLYLRENTPTPMVHIVPGRWYYLHGAYTFGCMLASICLLVMNMRKSSKGYRKQHITLVIGHLLPMLGAFFYALGLTPNGMDPVPVIMSATSSLYIWALLSIGMLTVSPVARDHIFESMRDGVLVLGLDGRIVDYNGAATSIIPSLGPAAIGRTIEQIWRRGADTGAFDGELDDSGGCQEYERELKWVKGNETRFYRIRSSKLLSAKGELMGRTIVMIDNTDHMLLQHKLRRLAETDGLTGIYNRTFFLEHGEKLLDKARLAREPLAVILFDIDYFKSINDRYGHGVGDLALKHVVSIGQSLIDDNSVFGRYGGEEFVICLPGTSLGKALRAAEQIRQALVSAPLLIQSPAAEYVPITASFGIAAAERDSDGIGLEDLLREADAALYLAKRNGRNRAELSLNGIADKQIAAASTD